MLLSHTIQEDLLHWYDRQGRTLPWRYALGTPADPYRVWLSEVMLQQTTVATVKGYFERFTRRWPTLEALATAPLEEVLHAWQGLGYYARARNLHRCAQTVWHTHGGIWPQTAEDLQTLPGVGAYTAAAIAAIAFGQPVAVLDTNVERIATRLLASSVPVIHNRPALRAAVQSWTPRHRPGDFAQAMMDLGSIVCTSGTPQCLLCPLQSHCRAWQQGIAETLPVRLPKAPRPTRQAVVFWLTDSSGAILMQRRPPRGLLGGMAEFPSSPWQEEPLSPDDIAAHAPVRTANWQPLPGAVSHTFSHFHLNLAVWQAQAPPAFVAAPEQYWVHPADFDGEALPTVMRKVIRLVS